MNQSTIKRLNQINRRFYEITATEFDQTRGQAWQGWQNILPLLPENAALKVLDVGCGNGRFGVFLAERFDTQIIYHGIDNNAALLEAAEQALRDKDNITAMLESKDIVEALPDRGSYQLVALFGVIHHMPGAAQRLAMMRQLAALVEIGGLLTFACWRFYEYERFRKRFVSWDADLKVEAHDYLLDWRRGERALRYCHYVDDTEHQALIEATGMHVLADYRADGFTDDVNRYSILQKPG